MTLLFPFLIQIALSLGLVLLLGNTRVGALKRREVRLADIAVANDGWPPRARLIANQYQNQFEAPVLFYALVLMAMVIGADGPVMVGLAWAFVGSRLVHSLIHLNGNNVRRRFLAFVTGILVLIGMTITLAVFAATHAI
ncbi:MAPEG family protein [uncultured Brevundimonas sp.]|uniref:MAPEG family protein n=1 Tax=uncultured Brevundimonas sp. TaxID=213418 RepID=UPI0030EDA2D3|tara:strand:+ start:540 stop:956 length:417 start_codon:yes stop_codon:yes gene_type:complete